MAVPFAALSARVWVWQLPTYSGTKSYQNLLVEVYEVRVDAAIVLSGGHIDSILQNYPISFVRSGNYSDSSGDIASRNDFGHYWEFQAYHISGARYLYFGSNYLDAHHGNVKGDGYTLRCLVR